MDKNPPITGKNNVDVSVKDKTGKAVTDAKVTVEYSMPAMPGMPADELQVRRGAEGRDLQGRYRAFHGRVVERGGQGEPAAGKTDTARLTIDVK